MWNRLLFCMFLYYLLRLSSNLTWCHKFRFSNAGPRFVRRDVTCPSVISLWNCLKRCSVSSKTYKLYTFNPPQHRKLFIHLQLPSLALNHFVRIEINSCSCQSDISPSVRVIDSCRCTVSVLFIVLPSLYESLAFFWRNQRAGYVSR